MANEHFGTVDRGAGKLDLLACGVGLTAALVGLFLLCDLAAVLWPSARLAHGWIGLFAADPSDVGRTLLQGVVGSTAGAWVATALFVPVYNRMSARRH
ncbi:hypothetical protein [Alsobacter sp. R-9]